MALAAVLAGAAECHAVIDEAVVADLGGLADDDAHAVVNDEAASDLRAGVDLDAGAVTSYLRYEAREEHMVMLIAPVGAAVVAHGLHAGVKQQHLDGAFRGGVAQKICIYGFKQLVKHYRSP